MTFFPVTMLKVFYILHRHRAYGGEYRKKMPDRQKQLIRLFIFEGGGCDGCAMEIAGLKMGLYALAKAGFEFVLRPEEADWMVVAGSVTRALVPDLCAALQNMPEGKCLIALGDCAMNGGLFSENYASLAGVQTIGQKNYPLPGCPPTPDSILDGFSLVKTHLARQPYDEEGE